MTVPQEMYDRMGAAEELLGHELSRGDLASMFDRGLILLVADLKKRKFAATDKPSKHRRATNSRRHIPAHVKRAVRERDGGQCTFVGDNGHRCEARGDLEYDHVDMVARGGRATIANTRLLCRAHNQLEAERKLGAGFMQEKRTFARLS